MKKTYVWLALLLPGLLAPGRATLAQASSFSEAPRPDTLSAVRSQSSPWDVPPPTGRSQKTQGVIFMAAGTLSALSGVINMNRKDPCADYANSPFVDCVSNVEDVRTAGKVMVGAGGVLFAFGVLRYGAGIRKARIYKEWQRKNGVLGAAVLGTWDRVNVTLSYRF